MGDMGRGRLAGVSAIRPASAAETRQSSRGTVKPAGHLRHDGFEWRCGERRAAAHQANYAPNYHPPSSHCREAGWKTSTRRTKTNSKPTFSSKPKGAAHPNAAVVWGVQSEAESQMPIGNVLRTRKRNLAKEKGVFTTGQYTGRDEPTSNWFSSRNLARAFEKHGAR